MINEVHVEFICRDEILSSLQTWATQNPQARLMLLVDTCPHCFWVLTPCGYRERYTELGKNFPTGLHTHLYQPRHWWVSNLNYAQQHRMLENGVKTLSASEIKTTHFAPGNWKFNRDSIRACHELGLLNFHWNENEENKGTVEWAKKHYKDMNFISARGCYTHDITIHRKAERGKINFL